jgi:four helix bundle protein
MKDFKKLLIWQLGMDIVDKIYDVIPQLPYEEKFGMKQQLTRSASSVPANIAEGSAKRSERDYARFVEMALGSLFELETHLLVVQRRRWLKDGAANDLIELVRTEQKMILKFIGRLDR